MFHEMALKMYFMKYSERKVSQYILALNQQFLKITRLKSAKFLKLIKDHVETHSSQIFFLGMVQFYKEER